MRKIYIALFSVVALLVIGVGVLVANNTGGNSGNEGTQTTVPTEPRSTNSTEEFNGPVYTCDLGGGSGLEIVLSSSSVKVGETLLIRGKLTGPAAWSLSLFRFTVIDSNGEAVYRVYAGWPHKTLAPGENPPQEYVFYLKWEAKKDPMSSDVEVTPGTYTFILAPLSEWEGRGLDIRGTIEVLP